MKRKKAGRVQNKTPERIKKRLPAEARERIHQSGAHRDRTHYSRKEKHRGCEKSSESPTIGRAIVWGCDHGSFSQRDGQVLVNTTLGGFMTAITCLVCGKVLPPVVPDSLFYGDMGQKITTPNVQPHGGVVFVATGNYGSTVHDPAGPGNDLIAIVCDECITTLRERMYGGEDA